MMGRTLSLYFYFRYLKSIAALMLGIVALILIIDFTLLIERVPDIEAFSVFDVMLLALYRAPAFAEQTLPFAALFTAIGVLISLNRRHELVVVRSVGVSVWQFMMPICAAALSVGVFAVAVFNPLASAGFSQAQLLETTIFSQNAAPSTDNIVPWLRQKSGEQEMIIGANHALDGGLIMNGITMIFFDEEGSVDSRIEAERATLRDGFWQVENATRYRAGAQPEQVGNLDVPTSVRPAYVQERLTDPESVSIWALPEKVEVARSLGFSAAQFSTQFQILLARPFLLAAMVVIAATVSLQFVRFGQASTVILGGIVAGFMLYVVSVLVRTFGASGAIPAFVAAWLPVVVAFALGVTVLLHKEDG
ncbi:LPS export ABC transporter permease LptG [Pararhizobium haloflavum]|uniref:LPS export ABC transporter permease LptG n=1 Tax=Pararhizobium haloflavum TaxID=2037914 RepID=UPI000C18F8EF|nr:LPS export ABC transporter permease LptG [Pararhizobium haloflavum]